jgi:hypothetical protein
MSKEAPGYTDRWNTPAWLMAGLWLGLIFASAPLARSIQKFIYAAAGKEFFTYLALASLCAGAAACIYFFIVHFRISSLSQYLWLAAGVLSYGYLIFQFRRHPEEALHLVEYAVLASLVFNALRYKVRDWTIYVSTVLIILLCGIADELLQWMLPSRFWDYRDVGVNLLGGALCVIIIGKGVRPEFIALPVRQYSVKVLQGLSVTCTVVVGLCLLNTPAAVSSYSSLIKPLSWLVHEEPVSDYGYRHTVPDIGIIYSRLTRGEIKAIDSSEGMSYGVIVRNVIEKEGSAETLSNVYTEAHPFMYEFLHHLIRRDRNLADFRKTGSEEDGLTAYGENKILEHYFGTTLIHSGQQMLQSALQDIDVKETGTYTSTTGKLITCFSVRTVWMSGTVMLIALWAGFHLWKKKVSAG